MKTFSTTYLSAIVLIIVSVAAKFNLTIGSEELTSWITAGITIVCGIKIIIERVKRGDVTKLGFRR